MEDAGHGHGLCKQLGGGDVKDRGPLAPERGVKHTINTAGHTGTAGTARWGLNQGPAG